MAGIAGMVSTDEEILRKSVNICAMSDAIRARGSTGAGYFFSSQAALLKRSGTTDHVRGTDLVSELVVEGKTYVLLLDGTIFNLKELGRDLCSEGQIAGTPGCSELLIHAYVKWKEDFIKRLNGSFAFALWIQDDDVLILARDHLGTKPLYYTLSGKMLIFASDIKGITCLPFFETSLDMEGLSEIICLSPRHTPGSGLLKGIRQVRPGHYIRYSREGLNIVRYWKIEKKDHEDDLYETLGNIRELVVDSVKRQIQSEVPLCGLLSGGLYSSLITAIAVDHPMLLKNKIYNTWSVDYEKSTIYSRHHTGESDMPWIRWVCRRAGTRHHYILLSPSDLADSFIETTEAIGIPGMPDCDTSLLLLFREIQKDFGIVLSGDCSDEVFGTSIRSSEYITSGRKRLPWTSNLAEKISVFKNDVIETIKPFEFIEKCYEEALADYTGFTDIEKGLNKENEAQWFSLYWNLPCILERIDRISMACGLEVRLPFCDTRLTEYFWNIPLEMKRLKNTDRGLLREAMRGFLPSDILERKKNPYPQCQDPDYETRIRNMLTETVLDPCSPVRYLLNLKTLESMMKQRQEYNKRYTARSRLYGWIIQLDHFMRSNGITAF